MTFTSYAQTYEDVMLARAFAGVRDGFYIDVGAQDPRFDSVTKAFYDLGWHGINLEPVEHWHRKLVAERPRDINLCLAAGDHEGTIEFHETDESGLSTASAEFAARHRAEGHALRTRRVPVSTLDAICRAHDVRQVHFLKVDVEGAEAEVLRGLDLARLRPRVILVEATEPNSRVSTHAQWEHLLTDHGYRLVYQDGLNRFYLAREHEELAPAFAYPPNIFDDFVRREQVDLEATLRAQMAEVDALSHRRAALIDELTARIGGKDEALASLQSAFDGLRVQADATVAALRAQLDDGEARFQQAQRAAQAESRRLHEELAAVQAEQLRLHQEFARLTESHQADLAVLRRLTLEHEALQAREQQLQLREQQYQLREQQYQLREQQHQVREQRLQARLEQAERGLARLSREVLEAQAAREAASAQARHALEAHAATLQAHALLQADHAQVLASRSWRLTRPLRSANALLARLRERLRPAPPPASDADVAAEEESPLPLTEDAEAILAAHPVQPPAGSGA